MELQTSGKPIDSLMERVLSMNILSSDYFKGLIKLKTYHEVIDEIYYNVDHVEPWMTGNCRGPSTAFCLLYKFFTMKLTVKQVQGLITHQDSPYIRAIGFLYLRYMADPKILWSWFEPYVKDPEEFSPGSNGKNCTMGQFVCDVLLGQYYFDSLFPRIPVPIMRQIADKLEKMRLPTQATGVAGGTASRGGSEEGARRPPSVKAALSVSFGQRAPHRASTRDSSPVRRTSTTGPAGGSSSGGGVGSGVPRDSAKRPSGGEDGYRGGADKGLSRDGGDDRDRRRDGYDRDNRGARKDSSLRSPSPRAPDDYRGGHERERERSRDRGGGGRDIDGSRERGADRDREREYGRSSRDHERGRDWDRNRARDYDRGDKDRRDRDRDRDRDWDRSQRSSRDDDRIDRRGSSRDRSLTPGNGAMGQQEERKSTSSQLQKLKDLYGDAQGEGEKGYGNGARGGDYEGEDVVRLGRSTWR